MIFEDFKLNRQLLNAIEEAGYEKVYNLIMISFLWKQI